MADNQTSIMISAVDKTKAAFDSISRNLKDVNESALKLSEGFTLLGASIGIAGFVEMTRRMIDAADEMNDLSQRVGIGIKQLAAYQLAAEQSGASLESVAKGVKNLSTFITEHSDRLKAAGISAKNADAAMLDLADVFAAMPDGIQKTALATQLFGKAGMDLIPMLNLGSQGLEEAREKSAHYADEMQRLAPLADQFNDNLRELKLHSGEAGMEIANVLAPALNDISRAMAEAARDGGVFKALWVGLGGIGSHLFTDDNLTQAEKLTKQVGALQQEMIAAAQAGLNLRAQDLARQIGEINDQLAQLDQHPAGKPEHTGSKLTPEQAAAKARALAQAQQEAKAGADEMAKAIDQWLASLDRANDALDKQIGTLRDEVDTMGLSKAQQDELAIAKQDLAIAAKEQDAANLREAASYAGPLHDAYVQAATDIDEQIAKMRELRDLMIDRSIGQHTQDVLSDLIDNMGEVLKESKRQWDDWEQERKRNMDQIGQALADSLMTGGQGAGKALERYFKTIILKPVIEAVMSPISGAISNALYGARPGGGLLSAGASAAGGNLVSGVFNNTFSGLASSSLFSGTSVGAGMGFAASQGIGNTFAAFSESLAQGEIGQAIGLAVPYVGPALAIAGALGLFGGKKQDPHNNPDKTNYQFGLGYNGIYGIGGIGPSMYVSGQTTGKGRWADRSDISSADMAGINQQAAALYAAGVDLAKVLGVDASAIRAVKTESPLFSSAAEALGNIADQIATTLIPNVAEFQQAGESLGQTAQRVAGDIQSMDKVAKLLGTTLALTGDAATRAAQVERIVNAGGGSQAFGANIADFYQNFFSDAERQAQMAADLGDAFNKLGIEMPGTKAEFRALVEALMQSGEAGQVMAAKVLTLEGAFAKVADGAETSSKQILDTYKQLVDTLSSESEQLQLGDLSPLSIGQKYAAAGDALRNLWEKVLTGDQTAIGQLPGSIKDFLAASRAENSSSDAFTADYQVAQGMLAQARAISAAGASGTGTGSTSSYDTSAAIATAQQQALLSPWPDGSFINDPATGQVFHVENGILRWIPGPSIADAVFGDAWHNPTNASGAADLWHKEGALNIPGYAAGLDYVPYDNFIARLHKGERVQTNAEASEWRSGARGITGTDLAALHEEFRGLRADVAKLAATIRIGDQDNVEATLDLAAAQRERAHLEAMAPKLK